MIVVYMWVHRINSRYNITNALPCCVWSQSHSISHHIRRTKADYLNYFLAYHMTRRIVTTFFATRDSERALQSMVLGGALSSIGSCRWVPSEATGV